MASIARVYVAGPYTVGDTSHNIREAVRAAERLRQGHVYAFVPHSMFHLWDKESPHSWATWLTQCLGWVEICDAILRLPGDSPGAALECAWARFRGIPVFDDVNDVIRWSASRE